MNVNITEFLVIDGHRHMGQAAVNAATGLCLEMARETQGGVDIYRLAVSNPGTAAVQVERLGFALTPSLVEGDWRVFLDGGSLSWAGVRRLTPPDAPGLPYAVRGVRPVTGHRSNMTTVLAEADGKSPALLVSFLGQTEGSNYIDIWPDETGRRVTELEAWGEFATRPPGGKPVPSPLEIKPGERLVLDPLVVASGPDPLRLLEDLGDRVHARYGRTFDEPPISGMMTWYSRYDLIDEQLVVENLPIIADLFNGYPQPMRNILIVDDGWQEGGEWGTTRTDPKRFPHGFAWLAERAREHGVELGIWLSTTNVSNHAENFAALEPMLVRDAAGRPISMGGSSEPVAGRNHFPPDAARDDVRRWWRSQLSELSGAGGRYFKLDFFATRTSETTRGTVSLHTMMDGVWTAFRESCPPNTHLATCSCDTNLQVGRCDSVRIAADIGEAGDWPAGAEGYRKGLSSIASMWFKQRRFWVNDPDSAQIGKGCSLAEARVRATAVAFCGGHIMAGDDLRLISPERLEMLRRLMPIYPVAARPVDLFEQPAPEGYPARWALQHGISGEKRTALALFNLDAQPRRFVVSAADFGFASGETFAAWEWWQSRYFGTHTQLEIDVPPYDVAVIHAVAVRNQPVFGSLSHHYTGGHIVVDLLWNEDETALEGTLVTKPGLTITLHGHAPKPFALTREATFQGHLGPQGNWQSIVRTTGPRTPFRVAFSRR